MQAECNEEVPLVSYNTKEVCYIRSSLTLQLDSSDNVANAAEIAE